MFLKTPKRWAGFIFIAGLLPLSEGVAQNYRVASEADGFSSFQSAVINNSGVVLFSGIRNGGKQGVYKAAGGAISTILEGSSPNQHPVGGSAIAMNNMGLMALEVLTTFGSGFVVITNGPILGPANAGGLPVGAVQGLSDDGWLAVSRAFVVAPYPGSGPGISPCLTCPNVQMNNRHQILSFGPVNASGTPIEVVDVQIVTRFFPSGTGIQEVKSVLPVRTNVVATVPSQAGSAPAKMNDNGTVAYLATTPAGALAIYLAGRSDPFVSSRPPNSLPGTNDFVLDGSFAINNQGDVAFDAGSSTLRRAGIFKGTNALTDKIVATGDIVAGSPITVGSVLAFNDKGQVIFTGSDAQGNGLWVASFGINPPPPPPPTGSETFRWTPPVTPPDGSFGVVSNWTPVDGTDDRVPEKTSNHADTIIFDLPAQYSVSLGTPHAERMIVRNGNVTFTNGTIELDSLSFDAPSVIIDNAHLTLSFPEVKVVPMLTCNHALIGQFAAARLDVVDSADWLDNGSLSIGGQGEGILTIDSGGTVTSGESRIGGTGGGHVNIGSGGTWTTGNIGIGFGGQGDLTIQDGGQVNSDEGFIGRDPGLGNMVMVQGASTSNASEWQVGYLGVGGLGSGDLQIMDGGVVDALVVRIAEKQDATASVVVSGVDQASTNSSFLSAGFLAIGSGGVGELQIEDGGLVKAVNAIISELIGHGSVTVTGINVPTDTASMLQVDELLAVGNGRPASLLIEAGGQVESQSGEVSSPIPSTTSEARIVGSSSSWVMSGQLIVGSELEAGAGVVTLVDGLLQADSVEVDGSGTIRGFGTLKVDPAKLVVNAAGTISPGLSPGTITIQGNYEQRSAGQMIIELGGTNSADYDHLVVTGNALLGGTLTIRCINDFAPKAGDHFDFLNVAGVINGAFDTVALQDVAPGFQFAFVTNGPFLSISALNDGVFSSSLPGQISAAVTNIGGITYATFTISTTNTCETIALDGTVARTNNILTQNLRGTTLLRNDCADVSSTTNKTVVLGPLEPGDYSLRIVSAGEVIDVVAFTVPSASGGNLLIPSLLTNGSIQFHINGPEQVGYTIEASTDLINWIPVRTGTLPDTFNDPEAFIFLQRFYRAIIEP
jgi:T5SS/PEP-CTERM-associated repeat protein